MKFSSRFTKEDLLILKQKYFNILDKKLTTDTKSRSYKYRMTFGITLISLLIVFMVLMLWLSIQDNDLSGILLNFAGILSALLVLVGFNWLNKLMNVFRMTKIFKMKLEILSYVISIVILIILGIFTHADNYWFFPAFLLVFGLLIWLRSIGTLAYLNFPKSENDNYYISILSDNTINEMKRRKNSIRFIFMIEKTIIIVYRRDKTSKLSQYIVDLEQNPDATQVVEELKSKLPPKKVSWE